jgi:hypothetical protein
VPSCRRTIAVWDDASTTPTVPRVPRALLQGGGLKAAVAEAAAGPDRVREPAGRGDLCIVPDEARRPGVHRRHRIRLPEPSILAGSQDAPRAPRGCAAVAPWLGRIFVAPATIAVERSPTAGWASRTPNGASWTMPT